MAGKVGTIVSEFGGKLLAATALIAIAVHVTGTSARSPAPAAPPARPARHAPAPLLRVAAPQPAAAIARAEEPFVVRHILPIDHAMDHGEWVWDESGAPPGPIVITVDLAAQMLSVFRDGYEIGAAVIVYGAEGKPTPLGTFPITQKDAHHISTIYDVSMPYMLRLTNDGVSIHGTTVLLNKGSSGCVGVPVPFAAKLFAVAHIGDRVIITDGKTLHLGDPIIRARPI